MAGKHVGSDIYVNALTHNAPMPGTRDNIAWAEGRMGLRPNLHPAGSPESLAYIAGQNANSNHEAGPTGAFPVPPISFGFLFNANATTPGAITTASTVPTTVNWSGSIRFRHVDDTGGGAETLFRLGNNFLRLRIRADKFLEVSQAGGGLDTFAGLTAIVLGNDYQIDITAVAGAITAVLYRITEQTIENGTATTGGLTNSGAQMEVGTSGGSDNFGGLTSDFQYNPEGGNQYRWLMNENSGTAFADTGTPGGTGMTFDAGAGAWVPG